MDRGYVKLYRKIEDSGLLQHPKAFALFSYLLVKAAWKPFKYPTRYGIIPIGKGQCIVGRNDLASKLKQSGQSIRTNITFLRNLEILTTEPTNRFTIITLINYAQYQQDKGKSTSRTTSSQPAANQQLTTDKALKHLSIKKEYRYFEDNFKRRYETQPRPPKSAVQKMTGFLKGGVTSAEWRRRVDNYFKAPWPETKDLGGLLSNWDKMAAPTGGGNSRSKDLC